MRWKRGLSGGAGGGQRLHDGGGITAAYALRKRLDVQPESAQDDRDTRERKRWRRKKADRQPKALPVA